MGIGFDWSAYADEAESNARAVEKLRPLSVKRVMNELRVTHMTVIEAVRRVPDEKLFAEGKLPPWLLRNTIDRYATYTPEVEAWVERLREAGKLPPPLRVME